MQVDSSRRDTVTPLELWPVEGLTGEYLPAVVAPRGRDVTPGRSAEEEAAARFQSDFKEFIGRLTAEIESLRDGLDEVRTEADTAQRPVSLRERAADARVDELSQQVQKLNSQMARVLAQQEERERMRRFSD